MLVSSTHWMISKHARGPMHAGTSELQPDLLQSIPRKWDCYASSPLTGYALIPSIIIVIILLQSASMKVEFNICYQAGRQDRLLPDS